MRLRPPLKGSFKQEQELVADDLAQKIGCFADDVAESGLDSAQLGNPINHEWPIFDNLWRGTVLPSERVTECLAACQQPFSLNALIEARKSADRLILEYGKYRLSSRAAGEIVMRGKDHFCDTAHVLTFNDPVLARRLFDTHSISEIPLYLGPTPYVLRCRGPPYELTETIYAISKLRKDASFERLPYATANAIVEEGPLIWRPTTSVRKRLPDRRWGEER